MPHAVIHKMRLKSGVGDDEDEDDPGVEVLETPAKSPGDLKEYRAVRLRRNGLTAILVSDDSALAVDEGTERRVESAVARKGFHRDRCN